MIIRNEDRPTARAEGFKGGSGYMISRAILPPEGLYGKGRLFSSCRLDKGCEVGWHVHQGDGETFCILSGEGVFNDNGRETTVRPGDVCFTGDGEGHSLRNEREEPLEYVALILYR